MISGEIHHLRYSLILAFFAAIGAAGAIYLQELLWAMGAIGLVMLCCLYAFLSHIVFTGELQASLQALGSFMRGMLDTRMEVRLHNRFFAHLQYRCNNLLDVLDYYVRGDNAGFDTSDAEPEAYITKLKRTGIYGVLQAKYERALRPPPDDVINLPGPRNENKEAALKLKQQAEKIASLTVRQGMIEAQVSERAGTMHVKLQQMHKALKQIGALLEQSAENAEAEKQGSLGENVEAAMLLDVEKSLLALEQQRQAVAQLLVEAQAHIEEFKAVQLAAEEGSTLVHGLAGQTHMLALNVSNEAIRVGASDRGFSAVADDVRELASHAGETSKLMKLKLDEMEQVAEKSATFLAEIEQKLAMFADVEALHAQLSSTETERQALAIQLQEEEQKYQASNRLLAETLHILMELCTSMERDTKMLQEKSAISAVKPAIANNKASHEGHSNAAA